MQQQAIILNDDALDDDSDDFEDAKDTTEDEQPRLKQRSFEFEFAVDKLQGSLYRSDPDRRSRTNCSSSSSRSTSISSFTSGRTTWQPRYRLAP